ncbi:MAG: molybdopterin-guanine dinucleotide biosynthesis protein B [Bacillota bacterium]
MIAPILRQVKPTRSERVLTHKALGRVMSGDLFSPGDLPLFDQSRVDGYAIDSSLTPGTFLVSGDIAAGQVPRPVPPGHTSYISTGAMIPEGVDAVIPEEVAEVERDRLIVKSSVKRWYNVIRKAALVARGDAIFCAGTKLGPRELGLLGDLGVRTVNVLKKPSVGILAVGTELVTGSSARIRSGSKAMLEAAVQLLGAEPLWLGYVKDRTEDIARVIKEAVSRVDLLVTSGGARGGPHDVTPRAFELAGADLYRHIPAHAWGGPSFFGIIADIPFYGLSGQPDGALRAFDLFVKPTIGRMLMQNWWRPVVAISGHSGSGKTTLIRGLVELLVADGYQVGTIKHHHGVADPGDANKDTAVHRTAGARWTLLISSGPAIAVGDLSPLSFESYLMADTDIVLLEGFKGAKVPRFWLRESPDTDESLNDPDVIQQYYRPSPKLVYESIRHLFLV